MEFENLTKIPKIPKSREFGSKYENPEEILRKSRNIPSAKSRFFIPSFFIPGFKSPGLVIFVPGMRDFLGVFFLLGYPGDLLSPGSDYFFVAQLWLWVCCRICSYFLLTIFYKFQKGLLKLHLRIRLYIPRFRMILSSPRVVEERTWPNFPSWVDFLSPKHLLEHPLRQMPSRNHRRLVLSKLFLIYKEDKNTLVFDASDRWVMTMSPVSFFLWLMSAVCKINTFRNRFRIGSSPAV